MEDNEANMTLDFVIEKLNINDGDILLINKVDTHGNAEKLYELFNENGYGNCLLLFGFDRDDIKTLDEQEMKELGWVRC